MIQPNALVSNPDRRRLLRACAAATLNAPLLACSRQPGQPLRAQFLMPGAVPVVLDYWDARNFSFSVAGGVARSLVAAGKIYVLIKAREQADSTKRALWVGELRAAPGNVAPQPVQLQSTALPAAAVATWQLPVPVQDVYLPRGPLGTPMLLTVANAPHLARAQFVIDQTMRAAMDMNLCGDAVNQLTTWWLPHITMQGLAVLATADGVRLHGPMAPLAQAPSLPVGVAVEDYRVRGAR